MKDLPIERNLNSIDYEDISGVLFGQSITFLLEKNIKILPPSQATV